MVHIYISINFINSMYGITWSTPYIPSFVLLASPTDLKGHRNNLVCLVIYVSWSLYCTWRYRGFYCLMCILSMLCCFSHSKLLLPVASISQNNSIFQIRQTMTCYDETDKFQLKTISTFRAVINNICDDCVLQR